MISRSLLAVNREGGMENESQRHRLERCLKEVEEHPNKASAYYNLGLAYTVSGAGQKGRRRPT